MELLNQNPTYNLFGFKNPDYKTAKVVVLPVPYDAATTYKAGARDGPHAIIDASRNMEYYSEEVGADIMDEGFSIYTLEELQPNINSPEAMVKDVEKETARILGDGKVPMLLGGDHSIAIGSISALAKKRKDFSVLHFDAHSDSRDEYLGSRYCHACIMARARDLCDSCYSVGVRSIYAEGAEKFGNEILFRKDMHNMEIDEIVGKISKATKKNIYLTIDVDVLDPSEMPSTGTPEPDGLSFYEISAILRGVLQRKELLGVDFCELSPIGGFTAPNYLVAKLAYLVLNYAFRLPKAKARG